MKRRGAAAMAAVIALGCAPALTACQSWLALQPASALQLRAAQAQYVAEAAFKGASTALDQATGQGLLKGPSAAKARDVYEQAHMALLAARLAKANGDYAGELARASDAIDSAGRLQALTSPAPASSASGATP